MSRQSTLGCVLAGALVAGLHPASFAQEIDLFGLGALRGLSLFPAGADLDAAAVTSPMVAGAPGAAADSQDSGSGTGDAAPESSSAPRGRRLFADNEEGYEGGRGLITLEGISGMFLNPTSGTLPARSLTAQYCVGILEKNERTEYQHTAMLSYGITDWFELGVFGRITDPAEDPAVGGGGPLARVRITRDRSWVPEISVGGLLREGNERIDKRTVFVAASKHFAFEENAFGLGGVRLHGGFRQIWQNSDVNEANGSIFYGGVEVEFPYDLWLVGELSNNADVFTYQPYAFGVQWRPTQVVGMTVGAVQTGGEDELSLYVGIGATLEL
jgi:hypothetical protein